MLAQEQLVAPDLPGTPSCQAGLGIFLSYAGSTDPWTLQIQAKVMVDSVLIAELAALDRSWFQEWQMQMQVEDMRFGSDCSQAVHLLRNEVSSAPWRPFFLNNQCEVQTAPCAPRRNTRCVCSMRAYHAGAGQRVDGRPPRVTQRPGPRPAPGSRCHRPERQQRSGANSLAGSGRVRFAVTSPPPLHSTGSISDTKLHTATRPSGGLLCPVPPAYRPARSRARPVELRGTVCFTTYGRCAAAMHASSRTGTFPSRGRFGRTHCTFLVN
jgi:hypothetical protein